MTRTMTLEEIRSATMASICSTWATKTMIDMPNQPFTAPTNAAWIRPVLKFGNTFMGEIGDADGIGLRTGVLMISIFVPPGTGIKVANGYANTLEKLFRRKDIGDVMFKEPNTDYVGIDDGNGFYHLLMSCDFEAWISGS